MIRKEASGENGGEMLSLVKAYCVYRIYHYYHDAMHLIDK